MNGVWPWVVFQLYLLCMNRLWPMLLAVVCFTAYVLPSLTWGPFWASAMAASRACQERGWANADPAGEYGYGITNTLVWPAKPRSFGVSATMKF